MHIEDNRAEHSTREQPAQPSFYDRYGHDEKVVHLEWSCVNYEDDSGVAFRITDILTEKIAWELSS